MAHSRAYASLLAVVFVVVALSASHCVAALDEPDWHPSENDVTAAHAQRSLRQKRLAAFTRYAQRVSAVMSYLVETDEETALYEQRYVDGMARDNDLLGDSEGTAEAIASLLERRTAASQESHRLRRQRSAPSPRTVDVLGTSSGDTATTTETGWWYWGVHQPHVLLQRATTTVSDRVARAMKVIQVGLGGRLSQEDEYAIIAARRISPVRAERLQQQQQQLQERNENTRQRSHQRRAVSYANRASASRRETRPRTAGEAVGAGAVLSSQEFSVGGSGRATGGGGGGGGITQSKECFNGYIAVPLDARFECTVTNSSSTTTTVTAAEYAQLSSDGERAACVLTDDTGRRQCLCSLDFTAFVTSAGVPYCQPRYLDVRPALESRYLCDDALTGEVGLPRTSPSEYCVTTSRTAVLALPVVWRYAWLTREEMAAFIATSEAVVYPAEDRTEGEEWVVIGPGTQGRYADLVVDTTLFDYLTPPPAANETAGFAMTRPHVVFQSQAEQFSSLFCFRSPRKMMPFYRAVPLDNETNVATLLGHVNGTSSYTVTYDLSTVPDDLVEGGQLYMETGIRGLGVFQSLRVARVHVRFTDLPNPRRNYKFAKPFNVLYIALIAVIAAIVVGVGLAVLWYWCQREEDPEDTLVTRMHKSKEGKERTKEKAE